MRPTACAWRLPSDYRRQSAGGSPRRAARRSACCVLTVASRALGAFSASTTSTNAHAKKYALLLPLQGEPKLSPLYEPFTTLTWPDVAQTFAQALGGKQRPPEEMTARHWKTIAETSGFRPVDVMRRVQQLAEHMVAARAATSRRVVFLDGATAGHIEEIAKRIEANALKIAGRVS